MLQYISGPIPHLASTLVQHRTWEAVPLHNVTNRPLRSILPHIFLLIIHIMVHLFSPFARVCIVLDPPIPLFHLVGGFKPIVIIGISHVGSSAGLVPTGRVLHLLLSFFAAVHAADADDYYDEHKQSCANHCPDDDDFLLYPICSHSVINVKFLSPLNPPL